MSKVSNVDETIARRVQDPLCAADELAALVGTSKEIDRLIASHSRADADTFKKLATSQYDAAIRENVATNPNAPLDVLIVLSVTSARAVLLNPAFYLVVREDPSVLERLGAYPLGRMLAQKECPLSMINWAFDFYSSRDEFEPRVLEGIIENPSTPVEMLEAVLRLDTRMDYSSAEGLL